MLTTVLFTDVVGSNGKAAGARASVSTELLARHRRLVSARLVRFRASEVDTAEDGLFAAFDGRPAPSATPRRSSLPSASSASRASRRPHRGDERSETGVRGIAVNVGVRIAAAAHPRDVLVSSTVKDIVAGSGILVEERGEQELAGAPGTWRLFAAEP